VAFDCGCENNAIKASCDQNCPVYNEMADRYKERKAKEARQSYEPEREPKHYGVETEWLSAKEKYKDQFEKALEVMEEHIKKGVSKQDIVTLLNDAGFKTRTGRKWTVPILQSELKKFPDLNY